MPNRRETIALAAVHSIFLFALVVAAAMLAEPWENRSAETVSRAAAPASNCPGVKLNYPRVIKERLPNGKETSFRYNCIQSGFIAQSYFGNCPGCSGRTRLTNEPVRWGLCAVDTDVIPPKSYFYVPGYGPCRAADTGGGIKGKIIDLGFEVGTGWWSRRITNIYTLVK